MMARVSDTLIAVTAAIEAKVEDQPIDASASIFCRIASANFGN